MNHLKSNPEDHHDLDDFMRSVSAQLASEYARIQRRATEDPGTAGDEGEGNWAELLRGWLPAGYHVVTKGRLLSHAGVASPQVDVIVLKPSYPPELLTKKVYLLGGVAAAFESKLTLRAHHLREARQTAVKIKRMLPNREGSPYRELHSQLLYGVLAHSHDWKGERSTPVQNVDILLSDGLHADAHHPRELIDLLCVADLGTWATMRTAWLGPGMVPDWEAMAAIYGPDGAATSAFVGHSLESENQREQFTAIGSFIPHLLQKLAWEDPPLRDIARYFFQAKIPGSGSGQMTLWQSEIYSPGIRARVTAGHLLNGVLWDEWSVGFM